MDYKREMIINRATDELYRSVNDLDSINYDVEEIAGIVYRSLGRNENKLSKLIQKLQNCIMKPEEKNKESHLPTIPSGLPTIPEDIKSYSRRPEKVENNTTIEVVPIGEDRYLVIKNNFVVDSSLNFYGVREGDYNREPSNEEKQEAYKMGLKA